jgi:hypothetical protein
MMNLKEMKKLQALLRGLRSQKLNGRWIVELAAISRDGTRRSLGEK